MTAPTLTSDAELRWALAGEDGLPKNYPDPRIEAWESAGLIRLFGDRWRLNVRQPSTLIPAQRAYVADDQAFNRAQDI